jgi:acetyl-CoA acetyltransferase
MTASDAEIAIVGYAQSPLERRADETEVKLVLRTVTAALNSAHLARQDIGFTCSGSCDYLSGGTFTFVANLDALGAWPAIEESHVEMDGAWALYEAWIHLLCGHGDTALVFGSGKSSTGELEDLLILQNDPYYLTPLGVDPITLAALQARALLDSGKATEADFAAVASRSRKDAMANPNAQVTGDVPARDLLTRDYVRAPLRMTDLPPVTDGACAVVLARRSKALELQRDFGITPVWITGIDHRAEPHQPGMRDLTVSPSTKLAAERAGLADGPVDVAELSATFSHQEGILRTALGLGDDVIVNPSGGPLAANPVMATGLIRIAEAAKAIREGGHRRALAHATAGPILQQNLVCLLEAEGAVA